MSSTDISVIVGLGVIAALCAIFWFAYFKPRHARKAALGEIEQMFSGARALALSPDAYFLGLDKNWASGWKGRGVLVLTQQVLYFRRWHKAMDIMIPMDRIEAVGANSVGDGSNKARLLVNYRGMDDQLRVASWSLDKPEHWTELVQRIRKEMGAGDGEA